jgi:hypothetical protein
MLAAAFKLWPLIGLLLDAGANINLINAYSPILLFLPLEYHRRY